MGTLPMMMMVMCGAHLVGPSVFSGLELCVPNATVSRYTPGQATATAKPLPGFPNLPRLTYLPFPTAPHHANLMCGGQVSTVVGMDAAEAPCQRSSSQTHPDTRAPVHRAKLCNDNHAAACSPPGCYDLRGGSCATEQQCTTQVVTVADTTLALAPVVPHYLPLLLRGQHSCAPRPLVSHPAPNVPKGSVHQLHGPLADDRRLEKTLVEHSDE